MRLGKKLIGLKVFALATGEYIAVVRDLLFDPKSGSVVAFVVELWERPGEERVLPLSAAHSVGENAVTVADRRVLKPISEASKMLRLAGKESIIGQAVMTTGGKLLGTIDDVLVDTLNGALLGYSLSDGLIKDWVNGQVAIPASSSYCFGEDAVIVPEDTTEQMHKVELDHGVVEQNGMKG